MSIGTRGTWPRNPELRESSNHQAPTRPKNAWHEDLVGGEEGGALARAFDEFHVRVLNSQEVSCGTCNVKPSSRLLCGTHSVDRNRPPVAARPTGRDTGWRTRRATHVLKGFRGDAALLVYPGRGRVSTNTTLK